MFPANLMFPILVRALLWHDENGRYCTFAGRASDGRGKIVRRTGAMVAA